MYKRDRVGRKLGYNSQEVSQLDAEIDGVINDIKNARSKGYLEDIDMDGDDEFEFDLDMDPEDEDDFEDDDFDGQPSDYDEWQDYMGGDDWDHGQYDAMEDADADEVDFDDEDIEVDDNDFEDDEDDFEDDEDDFEDDEDDEDFDFDDDDEDFDDEETDTAARLDDLEDKLNMLLSKFAEVLATDIADDEPEFDDEEDDEDDLDLDDEEGEDDDFDPDDFDDEEDVEEYADNLPDAGDPDDYDYETDDGFRLDYEGPMRKRMQQRRQRRWKDHRINEFQPDADDSRDIRKHIESLLKTFERYIERGMEDSPEATKIQRMLKKAETRYPEVAAEVIRDKYGE